MEKKGFVLSDFHKKLVVQYKYAVQSLLLVVEGI